MSNQLDIINRSALEFNFSISEEMKKIARPLLNFGIIFFTYVRFFNDGRLLYISSNLDWVRFYIENNFQDVTEHIEHYVPQGDIRYSLWSGFKKDKVLDALYELDLWNGFTIHEKHSDYTNYFDFSAKKENSSIVNFYLNNIELLEEFVKNFKNKSHQFTDLNDQSRLLIPKKKVFINKINHTNFVENEKINSFMRKIEFKRHNC